MVQSENQQRQERRFLAHEFERVAPDDFQGRIEAEKIVDTIIAKTEKGVKENEDFESLKKSCVDDFEKITDRYGKNLDIEKVCTHIENMAKTDKAQEVIKSAFAPIKAVYFKKEKQFKEALDQVQDEVVKLGKNSLVIEQMGEGNAEMLDGIAQKMNERLKVVTKPSHRAEILTKGIGEMQKFVENAEKQAGKGQFDKVINVLKSALKVVGTLGLDKSAKLKFAAAKFVMNNENASKIKEFSSEKTLSRELKSLTNSIKTAQSNRGL